MYFPKGIFPSGNFPRVFSQVEISKMCIIPSDNFLNMQYPKRQLPKYVLAAALDPSLF
jgi:hypothetical protein